MALEKRKDRPTIAPPLPAIVFGIGAKVNSFPPSSSPSLSLLGWSFYYGGKRPGKAVVFLLAWDFATQLRGRRRRNKKANIEGEQHKLMKRLLRKSRRYLQQGRKSCLSQNCTKETLLKVPTIKGG